VGTLRAVDCDHIVQRSERGRKRFAASQQDSIASGKMPGRFCQGFEIAAGVVGAGVAGAGDSALGNSFAAGGGASGSISLAEFGWAGVAKVGVVDTGTGAEIGAATSSIMRRTSSIMIRSVSEASGVGKFE
jgi:hypothetical protein